VDEADASRESRTRRESGEATRLFFARSRRSDVSCLAGRLGPSPHPSCPPSFPLLPPRGGPCVRECVAEGREADVRARAFDSARFLIAASAPRHARKFAAQAARFQIDPCRSRLECNSRLESFALLRIRLLLRSGTVSRSGNGAPDLILDSPRRQPTLLGSRVNL